MILLLKSVTKFNFYFSNRIISTLFYTKRLKSNSLNQSNPFLKNLFVNKLNLDFLDYPELNNPDEMFRANELSNKLKELLDISRENNECDRNILLKIAESNFLSLIISQPQNGIGLNRLQSLRVAEQLQLDLPLLLNVVIPQLVVIDAISNFGSLELKDRVISVLTSWQKTAILLSSINTYSAPDRARFAAATLTSSGRDILDSVYRVSGRFRVRALPSCSRDSIVLMVHASPADEHSIASRTFIISADSPNVSVTPSSQSGHDSDRFTEYDIGLSDVEVPAACVLEEMPVSSVPSAEPREPMMSQSSVIEEHTRAFSDSVLAASMWGQLRTVLEQYTEFVTTREVFGVPLFEYESVRNDLTRFCIDCFFCESALYFQAGLGHGLGTHNTVVESAATKTAVSESLLRWERRLARIRGHSGLLLPILEDTVSESWRRCRHQQTAAHTESRLMIARACVRHLAGDHAHLEYGPVKRVLSSIGFVSDVSCVSDSPPAPGADIWSRLGLRNPHFSSYFPPDMVLLTNMFFNDWFPLVHELHRYRLKYGLEVMLADQLLMLRISEFVLQAWFFISSVSRVSRAICLKLPTHRHQNNLVMENFSQLKLQFTRDRIALSKHLSTFNKEERAADISLWACSRQMQQYGPVTTTLPHPFDV